MDHLLTSAVAMHQAAQLGSAARLYYKVLSPEQDNADALHLLRVVSHQQGDHTHAVELISRAFFAPARSNLGQLLLAHGQVGAGVAHCHEAVKLEPDRAVLHHNLGTVLRALGRLSEARAAYLEGLRLDSDLARALAHLGLILWEAYEHYRATLSQQPDSAAAQLNPDWLHEECGDLDQAGAAFREALRLQPAFALPHARLATLLRDKLPDSDITSLAERLADPELSPHARARRL